MKVELYTRRGCHLCEVAEQQLRAVHLAPQLIDVDASEDLLAKYNTCVPVVVIDGKVRFRGKVDPILLKRIVDKQG